MPVPKVTTKFGDPLPPEPPHSVTTHIGDLWADVDRFLENPPAVMATMKNLYPRMRPRIELQQLSQAVLALGRREGESESTICLLFPSLQTAQEVLEFATSDQRNDPATGMKPVPVEQIRVGAFVAKDVFFAVFFPAEFMGVLATFWHTTGAGLSSRFAEDNLGHLKGLREVPLSSLDGEAPGKRPLFDSPAHQRVKERLLSYLERAPLNPDVRPRPTAQDVYLFPSGMASIYKSTRYLFKRAQDKNVLFGLAFADTLGVFTAFGGLELFARPGDELGRLERFLAAERNEGRKVQAIWVEFPANPLIHTPDITRLRELADEYDTILAIDDTIAGVANVDVLNKADILMTSLTKGFNGYADAIAGSIILNPARSKYRELKALFDDHHVPELYAGDAEVIERNSRDYLERMTKLNRNADAVTKYLDSCAKDPRSVVQSVSYPSLVDTPGSEHYRRFMRPSTPDFKPGFGALFSVEFANHEHTKAFYDNLNLHKGPHFGAPLSLVFPYVAAFHHTKLDWAAEHGMRPTQIRIGVGNEDTEELLAVFRQAVEDANRITLGSS